MASMMMIVQLAIFGCWIVQSLGDSLTKDDGWTLKILHTNDMHARFIETSANSGECLPEELKAKKCYGGFARIATLVRQARNSSVPSLFLNAGDTYTGSIWFTIHKWKIVSDLLNFLQPDAISLGNHEFDEHISGLIPFINASTFPIVTSNLNLTNEPELAKTKLQKSVVLDVAGHEVGIIGFLTPTTKDTGFNDGVEFLDEIESVRKEVKRLQSDGVDILIALGHSGFDVEKQIAAEVEGLDLVIGGHTNTFLYNGDKPDLEDPEGLYPTQVAQKSGRIVYVVQAYAYTKYVGNLTIDFDKYGEIKKIQGNPILVNASIEQAQDILDEFEIWRNKSSNEFEEVVGSTSVFLDGDSKHCRVRECNLGNLIVDAMVDYNIRQYRDGPGWTDAAIAIHNSGSIRVSIEKSIDTTIISRNIREVLPFHDEMQKIQVTSSLLLQMLERSVSKYDINRSNNEDGGFLHFSGLQVVYDLSQHSGSRVKSVFVRCADCAAPYFEPLKSDKIYKILINRFIRRGGDGYTMLSNMTAIGMGVTTDEILEDYISRHSPVHPDSDRRIQFVSI